MRSERQFKSADNTSMPQMTWRNIPAPLAICNKSSKWNKKLLTLCSKWGDTNCIICWNKWHPNNLALAHIWMHCICSGERARSKEKNRQMETKVQSQHLPGTFTITHKQFAPNYVSSHWACITSVPHYFWWLLRNNQARGTTHSIWMALESRNILTAKICHILWWIWKSYEQSIQNFKPESLSWNNNGIAKKLRQHILPARKGRSKCRSRYNRSCCPGSRCHRTRWWIQHL